MTKAFWKGKKVFLTGHTGFKGGWMAHVLTLWGAKVHGYALAPETNPNLFKALNLKSRMSSSTIADIRDFKKLKAAMTKAKADVVLHLAAQPLVRRSYAEPIETFETNVMGTLNLLEVCRNLKSVKSIVVVTTDKCYENRETGQAYKEVDHLGGYDPYSSSKACAEILTSSYRRSFFADRNIIATARAGNVIGGGDWSEDRLIPDFMRAAKAKKSLEIRSPNSTRPWQHVFEPISAYLELAERLHNGDVKAAQAWNFGPYTNEKYAVKDVLALLQKNWSMPVNIQFGEATVHEAQQLSLDVSKAERELGWKPKWSVNQAIKNTADWYSTFYQNPKSLLQVTNDQVADYFR